MKYERKVILPSVRMRLVTLTPRSTLYHGSTRIYQIHQYYYETQERLDEYLSISKFDTDASLVPDYIWDEVDRLNMLYNTPLYSANPVSKEVFYLAIVRILHDAGLMNLAVSALLPEDDDLLEFANRVEHLTGPVEELFLPQFYSSMRLPIQFFTPHYRTAVRYATDEDMRGAVYQYRLSQLIVLPDLSDPETVLELAETVFTSTEPFSPEVLQYHVGITDIEVVRSRIIHATICFFASLDLVLEVLSRVCKARGELTSIPTSDWFEYFEEELITPFNLWAFVMSGLVERGRVPLHESDALLLAVLVDADGVGFSSSANDEFLIVNPQLYGAMERVSVI
jgi:hypothetical protein